MRPADISVVIPAINEESRIESAIHSALHAGAGEIIVVDGGSHDRTLEIAQRSGATKIVRSLPGRGIQLNSGALLVEPHQDVILFLHADNLLGEHCLQQICDAPEASWGAFHQKIDSSAAIYRWIERGNAMRVRIRRVAFGDQAIFVRKDAFDRAGGFDEIPLMEDVAFSRKMRRTARPALLDGPVLVSARRWEKSGPVRQTLHNWLMQIAYSLGASPQRLKRWYQ